MNLTKAEKIRLGTFLAVGGALLLGGIIALAGMKILERRDIYTVRFKESVGGLEASAQVKYQGLRVGRVETMHIAEDDPSAIEVVLALDPKTVLHEGTVAVMDSSGLTGLKTINLSPGDPRKPRLPPGSQLEAGKSLFDRITGQAESITLKVETIANQLTYWTGDENRVRLERLLDALAKLAEDSDKVIVEAREPMVAAFEELSRSGVAMRGTAEATTKTLDEIRNDLRGTLAAARGTLDETRRILHAIDTKAISESMAATQAAMKNLDARLSKAEIGTMIERLSVALAELTRLMGEMDLAVRASREDFVMSLKHVRQATEDLREFSRIIAQDPSVLLRGKEVGE